VAADLIGPWKINIQGQEVEFLALTCILEILLLALSRLSGSITAKTALDHVAQQFENVWLSRYPRPNQCIHDNGVHYASFDE
jgi:hypothetical protein